MSFENRDGLTRAHLYYDNGATNKSRHQLVPVRAERKGDHGSLIPFQRHSSCAGSHILYEHDASWYPPSDALTPGTEGH